MGNLPHRRIEVTQPEEKLLNKLLKRYESKNERKRRIFKALNYIQNQFEHNPKELKSLKKDINKMTVPTIPLERFKKIINTSEAQAIQAVSDAVVAETLGFIDIKREKNNIILRMLPSHTSIRRKRIFAVIRSDGGAKVVRYGMLGAGWTHLDEMHGLQEELHRYPHSVIEEYCGANLGKLHTFCKTPFERLRFDKFVKRIGSNYSWIHNITYNKKKKEVVPIDDLVKFN